METNPTHSSPTGNESEQYVYSGVNDDERSAIVGVVTSQETTQEHVDPIVAETHAELDLQHSYSQERDELIVQFSKMRRESIEKHERLIACKEEVEQIKADYAYQGIEKINTNLADLVKYRALHAEARELLKDLTTLLPKIEKIEARLVWLDAVLPPIPE